MTSENKEAYVWIWLPGEAEPIVAGRIEKVDASYYFNYGQSYLNHPGALAFSLRELPLKEGIIAPATQLTMAGCLRDSAPDAWGRRTILFRKFGGTQKNLADHELDELVYLLESGSDRIGALDFQKSATDYVERSLRAATLDELLESTAMVEKGVSLTPALSEVLQHGTAIGGARPKALIDTANKKFIAKFSSSADVYNVVKIEFVAMKLAKEVGIETAHVELHQALGKDVLLIERFDRYKKNQLWCRRFFASALTLFELDELMARYGSYQTLAEIIRHRFVSPKKTLKELFCRLCFNVLIGNTDDHARNHGAFWDGQHYQLSPAYDICPQPRTGRTAGQAMLINGDDSRSQLQTCISSCQDYLLTEDEAVTVIEQQIKTIVASWRSVCEQAQLSQVEQNFFWNRQILNPYIFENLQGKAKTLEKLNN